MEVRVFHVCADLCWGWFGVGRLVSQRAIQKAFASPKWRRGGDVPTVVCPIVYRLGGCAETGWRLPGIALENLGPLSMTLKARFMTQTPGTASP